MNYYLGYQTGMGKMRWCSFIDAESLCAFSRVLNAYTGRLILIAGPSGRQFSFSGISEFRKFFPFFKSLNNVKELSELFRQDIETTRMDTSGESFEFLSNRILTVLRLLSRDQLNQLKLYVETKKAKGGDFSFYLSVDAILIAAVSGIICFFSLLKDEEEKLPEYMFYILAALLAGLIVITAFINFRYHKAPYRTDQILLSYIEMVSREAAARDI